MKVKYIGDKGSEMSVVKGRVYTCLGIESGWYRIIDEEGEDYLYPPDDFIIIEE